MTDQLVARMADHPGSRPSYDELPADGSRPPNSSWGYFGEDDEMGAIGSISPSDVAGAARLVRKGAVFSLNWEMELPGPAILGRKSSEHRIITQEAGLDDCYQDYYPQSSSQWDSLAHVKHPVHGFYNGFPEEQVNGAQGHHLGIHNWGRRGIAGRFVLIDVARFRRRCGAPLDCSLSTKVTVAELKAILKHQRVSLQPADILLIRFGWTAWYESLDSDARQRLGDGELFACPGLANTPTTAAWLWDEGVAAVIADTPALESMPFDLKSPEGFLHYKLIALLGLALGEMFQLEGLAEDCAADGNYAGMFTAAPFNKFGGIGSPANALALK